MHMLIQREREGERKRNIYREREIEGAKPCDGEQRDRNRHSRQCL